MAPDHSQQNPVKSNKLLTRIVSALVMLPIAVFVILNGGLPFFILLCLLTMLILSEWNGICEDKPISLLVAVQALCAVLLMLAVVWGSPHLYLSAACSIVSVITAAYFVKANIVWALIGFFYALVPSISFVLISDMMGGEVVLWMMIVIWSMDTGAYFAGKNIGGPKMSPKISPNKTWSGLIGGTVTAMLFSGIYAYFMKEQNIPLFESATILLILSGLFAILSQMGDLAESAVKRKFSVKDSGAIIPGHGGVMDRVDGVLFVAPAVLAVSYVLYA